MIWRKNCNFFSKNRDRLLEYFSTLCHGQIIDFTKYFQVMVYSNEFWIHFTKIFSPFQVLWSNVLWTISTLQSFATKTKKLSSSQKNHFIYALVYFGKKLSRFLVKNQTKIQGASEKQRNYDIVNAKKQRKKSSF